MAIKTPETHPDHQTVGRYFMGWDGNMYFCDSYDPAIGFWMTAVADPAKRKNVSERAIGRTYHQRWQCQHCKRWLRYQHVESGPCLHVDVK